VTFDNSDARSLLVDEQVVFAHSPTNRSLKNLVRNLVLAVRVLRRARPRAVLTTGAGVAVPFALVGRLFGARVVYVESVTRIERPSLSCQLIVPFAARVYVQWEDLLASLPQARFCGSVFDVA
jgi:UDP-N-acetylglucosamine:LPS N-acetylglucosamine transferase